MRRLRQTLLDTGLAAEDDVIGCTPEEIARVEHAAAGFPLPDEYLAFLQVMGHGAGELLRGENIYYPKLLTAGRVAATIAAEPDESLTTVDRFFFGQHHGVVVYFFDRASSEIFCYEETSPDVEVVGSSFANWLFTAAERTKSILDTVQRRDAETEAIRQKLRERGELDW
jgi:hypothetical protein